MKHLLLILLLSTSSSIFAQTTHLEFKIPGAYSDIIKSGSKIYASGNNKVAVLDIYTQDLTYYDSSNSPLFSTPGYPKLFELANGNILFHTKDTSWVYDPLNQNFTFIPSSAWNPNFSNGIGMPLVLPTVGSEFVMLNRNGLYYYDGQNGVKVHGGNIAASGVRDDRAVKPYRFQGNFYWGDLKDIIKSDSSSMIRYFRALKPSEYTDFFGYTPISFSDNGDTLLLATKYGFGRIFNDTVSYYDSLNSNLPYSSSGQLTKTNTGVWGLNYCMCTQSQAPDQYSNLIHYQNSSEFEIFNEMNTGWMPKLFGNLTADKEGNLLFQKRGFSAADTSVIYLFNSDGIALNKEKSIETFEVYPNPAHDQLNLNLPYPAKQIQILDLHGKVLKRISVVDAQFVHFSIDDLTNGVYFISVSYANGNNQIHKIIIE